MYVSPEDARSDLLLAGAVFIFGPIALTLLLTIVPLTRLPGVGQTMSILTPVLLTIAVPVALVRYRGESWADFGLGAGRAGLGAGAALAVPIVVASLLSATAGGNLFAGLPVVTLPTLGLNGVISLVARVVTWFGLALLATYVATKARDAFRSDFSTVPEGMARIGRIVAIVAGAAALLRFATTGAVSSLVLPAGVAVTVYLVWRGVSRPTSTGLAALLAPTVLLALGSFFISFSAARLIEGAWTGALVAALGLAMAGIKESRGGAWPAVGLALVVALATTVPAPLRLGL